ncbi:hypothetical protein SAMN04487906_1168 [Zhouia amylolytica]|uniref:Hemerythrin HHE cation binding domain-containing protein n=1 Tax=Zhouia amylolytica TaxID=376730 RepID=A0A1I6RMC8_9FLAO|nr:hypothetical protein [Zhouia amylolytica]SFS65842.1 hypothetical protein SAMN04487906_1168 [Zhouia amylolytica]
MVLYSNPKYLEWKGVEEMHHDATRWMSELQFLENEHRFLEDLLGTYFLKLSSEKYYDEGKSIAQELSVVGDQIKPYIDEVRSHNNELEVLIDGVDQPFEEKEVKATHRMLHDKIVHFISQFNELKLKLYVVIQEIMKESKAKHLLK